jgi:hypothetical protein
MRDGGNAVGRVSAIVNRDLKDRDGTPVGALGFFECVDDYAVARSLLDDAIGWLHDTCGSKRIWGPVNFDMWHGYRFMTQGFEEKPFIGEPRNKPYYPEFFQHYGFARKAEWDSLEVTGRETIARMISRGESRYRLLLDRGYRFEHMRTSRLATDLPKLYRVLCDSFAGFLGYTPIPFTEFTSIFEQSRAAFDPDFAILVYNQDDDLVGFATACLELADAVLAMNGKVNAWSRLKFARHRRQAKALNFYIGGVIPEEINRRSGLGRAGFYYIIQKALDRGFETILLTLRLKSNLAHGLAARSGCTPQREYALYEWNHE